MEVDLTRSGEPSQVLLDELPEYLIIPLGTRGFERVKTKQCQYCTNDDPSSLRLLNRSVEKLGGSEDVISYLVLCKKCDRKFTLRCRSIYSDRNEDKTRVISFVSVLDEKGKDQGWLGNF